jgi:hypothetical protein
VTSTPAHVCTTRHVNHLPIRYTLEFNISQIQIFTGEAPFYDIKDVELAILRGIRPTDPYDNSFSRMLWSLMNRCWDENPDLRPEAEDLLKSLIQLAQNANVDISPAEGWDSRFFNRTWNSAYHGHYLPSTEVSEFITTHE